LTRQPSVEKAQKSAAQPTPTAGFRVEGLGGKLEAFYLSFGEHDWVLLADLPDNASATAFSFAVTGSGLLRATTTPLVSVEETDKAFQKKAKFQAPGQFTAG
jgi:uncharacterized protein with GYD domain